MADTQATPAAAIAAVKAPTTPQSSTETSVVDSVQAKPVDPNEAFARKERQLRKMQQELQSERQALLAKQKSYETDYVPKSKFKEDLWGTLEEQGIDYDTLTQEMLNRPNDPATRALMAKIKALETKQSAAEQQAQDAVKAQYEQAKKQISNEVLQLVDSDPNFETIKQSGMHDAVVELIEQTFHSEGFVMDASEAARQIEEHLVEESYKMAQLPKVQARMKPAAPAAEEVPAQANQAPNEHIPRKWASSSPVVTPRQGSPEQRGQPMRTLSNDLPAAPAGKTSTKERMERALLAFKGQLK